MAFDYTVMKTKVQKHFNEMYKNNPKIDQILIFKARVSKML